MTLILGRDDFPEPGILLIDDNALRQSANNLTFVRLVLASSIMYSHCLWQTTGSDVDAVSAYVGAPISVFAVNGFFFISGFLVYRSLCINPDLKRFTLARIARLWPGLAAMSTAVVFVGLFETELDPFSYLASAIPDFIIGNLSLMVPVGMLPGVLCDNAPCIINGSLWSIPWEVRCYIGLGLIYAFGLASRRAMIRLILPLTVIYAIACHVPAVRDLMGSAVPRGLEFYIDRTDRLWTAFALGMFAYIFRRYIVLRWEILVAFIATTLAIHVFAPAAETHAYSILAGYLVLSIGFLTVKTFGAFSAKWPDYSYGLYIYAFPVMFWAYRSGIDGFYQLLFVDLLVTTLFAAASWHLVESPALNAFRSFYKERSLVAAKQDADTLKQSGHAIPP